MVDPKFKTGQIFQSTDQLRKAIREHSCKHRKNIKFPKNDKIRVLAKCEDGCPWEIYASSDSRTKSLMVKRYQHKHTCENKWQVTAFTARYIGHHYVDEIRANEKMTLRGLGQLVQKDWKMTPKRGKLGRARKIAFEIFYGDETAQYNQLWDFGQELRRLNKGMSGIPCWHAVSALRHGEISPESYVSACYSIQRYRKAYENIIWPCRDVKEWEKVDGMTIKAPRFVKKVGRPQKNRRQQPEEKEGKNGEKKMSKHGSVIHCGYCGVAGHNKGGCTDWKLGLVPKKKTKNYLRTEPDVEDEDLEHVALVTKVTKLSATVYIF